MRIGAIDIGSNSTRLLVAEIDSGELSELERRSTVTRLGTGVDSDGKLSSAAQERVFDVLTEYRELVEQYRCDGVAAVMTSAVRDAANGTDFAERVRSDYVRDADVIDGDEEARLTFLGATSARELDQPTVVIDIGGGSTEFVVGSNSSMTFHTSLQTGVVRQTERYLAERDPTDEAAVGRLRAEVAETILTTIPSDVRAETTAGIAVAGTATSAAAIDQALEPYDPTKVHGYALSRDSIVEILERLIPLGLTERKAIPGLHPDRALTIVSGIAILLEAIDAFQLSEIEVSEYDILRGIALEQIGG